MSLLVVMSFHGLQEPVNKVRYKHFDGNLNKHDVLSMVVLVG